MDWGRYQRALQLRDVVDVEQVRFRLARGEVKADKIGQDVWQRIVAHDELLEKHYG